MGNHAVPEHSQIRQHRERGRGRNDSCVLGELLLSLGCQFNGRIDCPGRCLVRPNHTFLEEEVSDFVARELVVGRPVSKVEAAVKRIRPTILVWHIDDA